MNKDQIIGRNIALLNAISSMVVLLEPVPGEPFNNDLFIAVETTKAKMMLPPDMRETKS